MLGYIACMALSMARWCARSLLPGQAVSESQCRSATEVVNCCMHFAVHAIHLRQGSANEALCPLCR